MAKVIHFTFLKALGPPCKRVRKGQTVLGVFDWNQVTCRACLKTRVA